MLHCYRILVRTQEEVQVGSLTQQVCLSIKFCFSVASTKLETHNDWSSSPQRKQHAKPILEILWLRNKICFLVLKRAILHHSFWVAEYQLCNTARLLNFLA